MQYAMDCCLVRTVVHRWIFAVLLALHVQVISVLAAVPRPPYNITLSKVSSTSALIQWQSEFTVPRVTRYGMTLDRVEDADSASSSVDDYEAYEKTYLIEQLSPDTLYQLFVSAYSSDGKSNRSKALIFRTLSVLPSPPHNLRLQEVSSTEAEVKWHYDLISPKVTRFDMTLFAVGAGEADPVMSTYGVSVDEGESEEKAHVLEQLLPDTRYRFYVVAYNGEGASNASSIVTFKTLPAVIAAEGLRVDPIEVLIVFLIVLAWICAIILFRHKWDKIRIIQPCEPRYRHQPKNLDTIKVVQRPTDSVIYKNYSKGISKNMQARETKRIERMNTMPNIKVSDVIPKPAETVKKRTIEKRCTVPFIELDRDAPKLDKLKEEEHSSSDDEESQARMTSMV